MGTDDEGELMIDDHEAIRGLKARYFRFMDTKDWARMRTLFTADSVLDMTGSPDGVVVGGDAFVSFLEAALAGAVTAHHGHTPEIVVSGASAEGIWAMQDYILWPDGNRLIGFGHYHDTYARADGRWRIATSRLARLHVDVREPDGTVTVRER